MKKLSVFLSFVYMIFHISAGLTECAEIRMNSVEILNINDSAIMNVFYLLWRNSTTETESAIWILRNPNGHYEFRPWHRTPQRRIQTWHDPLPKNIISVAHTHPNSVDPKPSKQDQISAKQLGVPIYTISRKGIWRVTPDGGITQEVDHAWFKKISLTTLSTVKTTGK